MSGDVIETMALSERIGVAVLAALANPHPALIRDRVIGDAALSVVRDELADEALRETMRQIEVSDITADVAVDQHLAAVAARFGGATP